MKAILALLLLGPLSDPERMEWKVDDVEREALVCAPSKPGEGKPPLVFAFHGHGGTMRNAARSFAFHERWPEAVVVYPQGLLTPASSRTPRGRSRAGSTARGITATETSSSSTRCWPR